MLRRCMKAIGWWLKSQSRLPMKLRLRGLKLGLSLRLRGLKLGLRRLKACRRGRMKLRHEVEGSSRSDRLCSLSQLILTTPSERSVGACPNSRIHVADHSDLVRIL
ncbi:unnamed protein product [Linum trigynum]|uniref:Uncharacterized protein n=1 Tax=Linum trigynum TaxID=586398 RepID=A0AAV2EPS1_9ROSI